jgi:tripartite-type tricarboxylate transporter receptor subunit TctC
LSTFLQPQGEYDVRTRTLLKSLLAIAMAGPLACASAQTFPSRPLTIVVPFPAGGALDNVARSIAEQMRTDLGQAVIVDNRAGAGGTLGSSLVARASPDGYTMLLGSVATHAIAAGLYPKLPYDPIGDFAPITQLTSSPLVLTASPQLKAANVAGLVAAAKASPGSLNYASTGNGTALHLAGEVFRTAAGINVLHVPYKGGGQAATALLAGEVSYMLANPQLVMSFIQAGKLRVLAVTGTKRLDVLPEVPTLTEAGIPGVEVTTWFGLWAPKGTPAAVVERLNASARKALATPEVKKQLAAQGESPIGSSVEDFATFVRAEHKHWVAFVQAAGIKLE